MPCVPLSMLGSPGELTAAHGGWDSKDVSVAGVCDCVKECMGFVMYLII